MMTKFEAALTYASWGWHVLPVVPNGKIPATQHGVNDATTNPETITKWWAQNPDFNVGVAAGERSGIIVFDIDPRNGGDESWHKWVTENGAPDDCMMQMTAGGGQHYIADHVDEIRSCKLSDGIDLLANGRYFLAHPSTIDGRKYEWEASSDPFDGIAPLRVPQRWLEAYRGKRAPAVQRQNNEGGGLIKGSRNDGLTALGGAMRRHGMTEGEILASLTIANETRCDIPLPSSELAQIVRSVCRYEPEHDTAAHTALGSAAAESLLAATRASESEYHMTRATSYLTQPAALRWIIKGWVPDAGVTMVYGESGCGKPFLAIDQACHIAAGLPWHGIKAKNGVVVYLAGEGNYGIRSRITAWCKAHGVTSLDNLLVSNRAIDMDNPAAPAQIIEAVRELTTDDVVMVIVDTLNNHMAGDENSAQDARRMINSAMAVSKSLNSALMFLHHTGVSEAAKFRARGSSAIKASMDSQIFVEKKDAEITVYCTKMKDDDAPKPIFGVLRSIDLGWKDEDGEEITGAYFDFDESPRDVKEKKESSIQRDIKKMINAWGHSGNEELDNRPYISNSAFMDYLITQEGIKESTAKQYMKPGHKGGLIDNLITSGIIAHKSNGWAIIDNSVGTSMLMAQNG